MNRLYILLFVIIWTIGPVEAQSLKQFKDEAAKATLMKDFGKSFKLYKKIIEEADEKSADNYFQAAESAREFRIYEFAEKYYKEIIKDSVALSRYRLTKFHLGTVLKSQAKYDEAIETFKSFIEKDAAFANESFSKKAEKEIIDCKWAKTVSDDGTIIQHLDSTVNTPNSEFGPFEYDSILYYSTVRFKTDRKYEPIPPLARLFSYDQIHEGKELPDDFNLGENLHTGNVAFNADQTRMYYTICKNVNVSDIHCKIYFRDKNGENWGPVDSLSNVVNSNTYTTTQPSVGIDRESGKEILFFVTDRLVDTTDNYRDLNIWCSFMEENGEWGEPGFIDSVNTDGEDVTPFFHTPTQTLYFSSNGLRNLGGFDIYSIPKNGSEWGTIKGMGSPLNSSYDEMYYTINAEGSSALMSSNRPGGFCDPLDSLCICNDIYRMPQICLDVRTFNKLTTLPLFGTEVVLNENDMSTPDIQSKPDDYIYSFFVGYNRSYSVDGSKIGRWLPDMMAFNTTEMKGGECDTIDLFLEPLVDVDVSTCNKVTGEPLTGVNIKISVVDGTDVGFPKSKHDPLKSQYNFDLNFGRKYKILATKKGYSTDESIRTITEDIERVPTTLTDELCLCKLPPPPDSIRLYFANDEPGPHTRKDTTSVGDYAYLHSKYVGSRSLFYSNNEYGKRGLIDLFFGKIDNGHTRLAKFTSELLTYLKLLEDHETLTVIVRGYASPLGPQDEGSYNYALSKRRIDSIRQYFKNNLPAEQYAKLMVEAVPNGDQKSPKSVPRKGLGAIFGLDSSEERRVEIIALRLSKGTCIDLTNIPTEPIPNDSY